MSFFDTPRGKRNNNPFNIDYVAKNDWDGQIGIEPKHPEGGKQRFAAFATPVFGARAFFKILDTYKNKYKVDTVNKMVNRFAPPVENPTGNYASFVAEQLGVGVDDKIDLSDEQTAKTIAAAKVKFENGVDISEVLEQSELDRAYKLATGAKYSKEEKEDVPSRKKGELSNRMVMSILRGYHSERQEMASKKTSDEGKQPQQVEEKPSPVASEEISEYSEEEEKLIQQMMDQIGKDTKPDVVQYTPEEEDIIRQLQLDMSAGGFQG